MVEKVWYNFPIILRCATFLRPKQMLLTNPWFFIIQINAPLESKLLEEFLNTLKMSPILLSRTLLLGVVK